MQLANQNSSILLRVSNRIEVHEIHITAKQPPFSKGESAVAAYMFSQHSINLR